MSASSSRLVGAVVIVAVALTTNANAGAPAGRYTIASGTVYDTKTKLTWQQAVPSTTYAWAGAKTYCAALGTTLGGTGWRLPTIKEVVTLLDFSQLTAPPIDANAFPATPSAYFWSSTPGAGTASSAWAVNFAPANMFVGTLSDVSTSYDVRCVH
jgi:hypothetical protein